MNWELFVGRFHPLMVHLPIGIFILGYIFEVFFQLGYRNLINSRKIVIVTYCLGLLAGIVAALTGWLLSFSDDYGIEPLNDHKYLGIVTLVVMLLVIIYQIKAPLKKAKLKLAFSSVAILLTGLTGHFGGTLTHGPSYLVEYGPEFLKSKSSKTFVNIREKDIDSLHIYSNFIQPLFDNKCISCHNTEDNKGGLILQHYSNLFIDAEHDKPISAGNPDQSELLRRVSLPLNHKKIMPPRGAGFSYTDIQILRYWIENGADSLAVFNSDTMSKELITLINRDYGLDFSPKPYYEKVNVDRLDEAVMAQFRNSGFRVNYLSETNFLLDVAFEKDSINKDQIQILNTVSDKITFLKLSKCNLSDDLIKEIADLPNLTRIDISKNSLSADVVTFLSKLEHLESVNLNETDINSESLRNLLTASSKLRIYVRNTKITTEELASLKQTYVNAEIVSEFKFEEVNEAKSVFRQEEKE
jgi:uncharacterized membrane protein